MTGMYDLHTHTLLSDGEMLPIELIRRASVLGYTTLAIADHVDHSNLSEVIAAQQEVKEMAGEYGLAFLCGVEITHVPPACISAVARRAKEEGAEVVVVHGETMVEPVAPGTNHAACICDDVDVLAHPGLISVRDAREAARRSIALEITSRAGHNRANGHVAMVAREAGCIVVVDSDAHGPHDLLSAGARRLVARGAGLSPAEARRSLGLNISSWLKERI